MTSPTSGPPEEREIWLQTKHDYDKALAIALLAWPIKANPPEVIDRAAATILNHYRECRRASLPHNHPAAIAQNGKAVEPAPNPCPKCGQSEMYDNRGDKKKARSPDFKCKDPECDHAIWLTPPPRRAKAAAR